MPRYGVPAEVFMMILESLERKPLAKCLRVSRLWFEAGIPILWREPPFRALGYVKGAREEKYLSQIKSMDVHHVDDTLHRALNRSFTFPALRSVLDNTVTADQLRTFLPKLTFLQDFVYTSFNPPSDTRVLMEDDIMMEAIISSLPRRNLQSLTLERMIEKHHINGMLPFESLRDLDVLLTADAVEPLLKLITTPMLTKLCLRVDNEGADVLKLVSLFTELRSLEVAFGYKAKLSADQIMLLAKLVKLETLQIDARPITLASRAEDPEFPGFTHEQFDQLLSSLEHLRDLHLRFAWSCDMGAILESAARHNPPLEYLNLGDKLDIDMAWLKLQEQPLFPRLTGMFKLRRFVDRKANPEWGDDHPDIVKLGELLCKHFPEVVFLEPRAPDKFSAALKKAWQESQKKIEEEFSPPS
ncbi:hypothetical protein T310_5287 [Rasamsonia emersonii CBS 393.64]|uniref:F-box domain-containing protein n=1 Tax=Rasamsonia emersonii (strain ATCC 16479 / CBS 393.64 / IMI 116815) TaxID=1408163 RepID=A0A0F4YS66_RASE3|nr:hypothetical protein T310_5287 [Rasamsonia emersonii CBS 393.64]KKA20671.1 hypothetical protein T310_5287 [Rasamsonia emersonii CBS 393.64]